MSKTIKKRIEEYISRRPKNAKDVYVSIFNNTCEYSPNNFGFYLSDFDEFKNYPQLDYPLDTEKRLPDKLLLGFTHLTTPDHE